MELRGRVSVVTGQGPAWGWFVAEGMRAAGASVIAFDIVPGEGILAADVASERGRATVGEVAEAVAGAGVETTAQWVTGVRSCRRGPRFRIADGSGACRGAEYSAVGLRGERNPRGERVERSGSGSPGPLPPGPAAVR